MRIKQSFCYPLFKDKNGTLDECFAAAAKIGYPATEFWQYGDDVEEIIAAAKRSNLRVVSICGHKSLTDGLNKRSNHDRIEQELCHSIDLAAKHAIPGLICFSGVRQPYMSELEAIEATAEGLKRIAPYAEKKGINLNLELLNSKINHPGYEADHTVWGVAVCQKVNSPRVKLLYDIYHMQIMEGDVIRTIRENIRWIGHFHTAGVPDRGEFNDSQELNYVGICRAIAATGYDLYIGHEFGPAGDPIEALRRVFPICNQQG